MSVAELLRRGVAATDPRVRPCVESADADLVALLSDQERLYTSTTRRRFLVARELDASAAFAMMQRRLEWERNNLPVSVTADVERELRTGKVEASPTCRRGVPSSSFGRVASTRGRAPWTPACVRRCPSSSGRWRGRRRRPCASTTTVPGSTFGAIWTSTFCARSCAN